MKHGLKLAAGTGLALLAAMPAWANVAEVANAVVEAAPAAAAAAPATVVPDDTMVSKGDVAWMLVSSALVLMMSIPGLALFYGDLVRTKNMLSVMMQVLSIVCIAGIMWCVVGYSMAFTNGDALGFNWFVGGFSKALLSGVDANTFGATFSNGVYLPETVFVVFQMTFAMITPALIVGAFAERVKFVPLMVFVILWSILVYYPMAHMVWYWPGPDFQPGLPDDHGLLWGWGALDFAGGTVVHINAGIAGLMGCIVIGKRIGYKSEPMPPHSLTMTMIGAALLWVGWFGFNAGSNLEANKFAALAFINTMTATAAAGAAWALIELVIHKKPSLLGAASGVVAGLVAITPAAGFASPITSIVLGAVASVGCFFFVTTVKNIFKYDDTLDVFGIHCIGGIIGAIGTAIVANPAYGGQGALDFNVIPAVAAPYDMAAQIWTQTKAVGVTLALSGGVSLVLFLLLKFTVGLRPSAEVEMEGLDINAHGERAYNY